MPSRVRKNSRRFSSYYFDPLSSVVTNENLVQIEEEKKTQIPSKKDLIIGSSSTSITPSKEYSTILKEYEKMKKVTMKLKKAYQITFPEYPDLFFINFNKSKESASYQAHKYFEDNYHPAFSKHHSLASIKTRSKRLPQFDKYYATEKIPIVELMKELDITFHCSICGRGHYTYESYEEGMCFIVEGEGDLNPFTQGYLLCSRCHKRFLDIRK